MHRLIAPARTILRQRGFLGLLGCTLLLGLTYSFVGPFFSMFGTLEVGMSPAVFGIFMMTTSVSAIVLSTALARWSDTRCSRRSLLLLGGLCGTLGYAGYAVVRDVVWLTVIGSLLLGVASITFSQLFAYARELLARSGVSSGDTPFYMNVFRLFFALAWTAGPATASWVMIRYSYRGTFLVAALCFLLFLLAVLRFIPIAPPWTSTAAVAATPLRQALARPDLLAYFTAFMLVFISSTINMMNLPLFVLQTLGGSGRHVGIIYSLTPVFELPFMLYFGLLASRGDQARLIRIAVLIAVAYYGSLTLVRAPWQIYPLQILGAAVTAVISGVGITFFQNFLPDQVGTATNLYSSAARTGSTVGYLLFGLLAAAFGHRAVFLACTALCTTALAILFRYRARSPHATGRTGGMWSDGHHA